MQLRPATRADTAAIQKLVFDVLQEYGLAPDPAKTDRDLAQIDETYQASGGRFDVLVDDDGMLWGTVGLYPLDTRRCELRKMYLHPNMRGRGLGKRLLEHALEQARELGFQQVELETAGVLREATALYQRYGFRRVEREDLASRCDQAMVLDL